MLAIRNKHIKMVKYLLQNNANINESTYLGIKRDWKSYFFNTVKLQYKNTFLNLNMYIYWFVGMSVFGLAAAINKTMFETVYDACPTALLNSLNDDITPLCIAAMKNDKNLFFKLIELGFDVSKNSKILYIFQNL